MEKLKRPTKICIFGDSVGRGVIYDPEKEGYDTDRGFVSMLEKEWEMKADNFTRFGQTIDVGLAMLRKKIGKTEADTVFLEFGGNDCDFHWKEIAADPDAFHAPKTTLSEFIRIYKEMIEEVRAAGKTPIVIDLPPIEHNFYFDWVSRGVSGDNILKWLEHDKKEIYRWHESYSYAIYNVCRENRVKMINVRSGFDGKDLALLVCKDGIHPNVDGHRIIFEKILTEFE